MIILQRLTPYIVTLASALLLWFGMASPLHWSWVTSGLIALPFFAVLLMHQSHWRLEYLGLAAPMILLLLGTYSFLLIQENIWLQLIALVVTTICFFLFEKNVAVFLFQPSRYIPYSLEHISIYCTMVAAFFCYVSVAMLGQLHLTRLRYLFIIMFILTAIMVWQNFWIQKIAWPKMWRFIVVISVVLTQVLAALYFWPVSFFVVGCLLTLMLYLILHLSRHFLMQTLTKRLTWRYSLICIAATTFILATAQWYYH